MSSEEEEDFKDWVPEFTVWLVREGESWPMRVDSVFVDEADAQKRAEVRGGKWHAMKYSHIHKAEDVLALCASSHHKPRPSGVQIVTQLAEQITRLFDDAGASQVERYSAIAVARALVPISAASISADD